MKTVDYFIGAAAVGIAMVILFDVNPVQVWGGIVVVGLAELVLDPSYGG